MNNPIRVINVAIAIHPEDSIDNVCDALSDERDRGTFIEWAVIPDAFNERKSHLVEREYASRLFQSNRVTPELDE